MAKIATILLTHTPEDERTQEIVDLLVEHHGPNYNDVKWYLSEEIPAEAKYGVDVVDQLEAHKRDTPGSIYLTVVMANAEVTTD